MGTGKVWHCVSVLAPVMHESSLSLKLTSDVQWHMNRVLGQPSSAWRDERASGSILNSCWADTCTVMMHMHHSDMSRICTDYNHYDLIFIYLLYIYWISSSGQARVFSRSAGAALQHDLIRLPVQEVRWQCGLHPKYRSWTPRQVACRPRMTGLTARLRLFWHWVRPLVVIRNSEGEGLEYYCDGCCECLIKYSLTFR